MDCALLLFQAGLHKTVHCCLRPDFSRAGKSRDDGTSESYNSGHGLVDRDQAKLISSDANTGLRVDYGIGLEQQSRTIQQ